MISRVSKNKLDLGAQAHDELEEEIKRKKTETKAESKKAAKPPKEKKPARMDDSSEEEEQPSKDESPTSIPAGSNNLLEDLLGMDTGPSVSTGLEQIQFGDSNAGGNDLLGEMFGSTPTV